VAKNQFVLEPLLAVIGNIRLRDLHVTDVDQALAAAAASPRARRWRWRIWR